MEGSWWQSCLIRRHPEALQGFGPAPMVEGAQDQPPDTGQHLERDLLHPDILI